MKGFGMRVGWFGVLVVVGAGVVGCAPAVQGPTTRPATDVTATVHSLGEICTEAERGDAKSQCYLGECYQYGMGMPLDPPEGVKWYLKAAEQGNAEACYNLGVSYEEGLGVKRDDGEAIEWYEKGARLGNEDSRKALRRIVGKR